MDNFPMYDAPHTYVVEQNEKYGDFRVHLYVEGEWKEGWDNNWSEDEAVIWKERLERAYELIIQGKPAIV